jgi:inner membrane transporter RhtA
MVLSGIVSVQAGAGIAARLLYEIPPAAVTGLRLWTSAVAMAVVAGRRRPGGRRAQRRGLTGG